MITFRFYLVTLIAIFLAVALGVTIGSTFLEPALVQDLNNQVSSVRDSLDRRVATIDDLHSEIDDRDAYMDQTAAHAVEGRLTGTSLLIVAPKGTDSGAVERLVGRARQAGAHVEGIIWIEPSFGSEDGRDEVIDALGLDPATGDVGDVAWDELVRAGGAGTESPDTTDTTATTGGTETTAPPDTADSTDTTETTDGGDPSTSAPGPTTAPIFESDLLVALDDAGWIEVQAIDTSEPGASHTDDPPTLQYGVVLVTDSEADDDAVDLVALARRQATSGVPTVVAEVWKDSGDEGPERGAAVEPIREDAELAELVSTVDDLDLLQGQVAVVLALDDLASDRVGHYGYGSGSELIVPAWLGS